MTQAPEPTSHQRKPITIKSMLVLTAVFAAVAASLAHLYRAASGDVNEIGPFVITTAMTPLLMMVGTYWVLRIAKHVSRQSM